MPVIFLRTLIYSGPVSGDLSTCFDMMDAVMQVGRGPDGSPVDYVTHVDDYYRWVDLCYHNGVEFASEAAVDDLFFLCFAGVAGACHLPELLPWSELVEQLPADECEDPIHIYREWDGTLGWGWLDDIADQAYGREATPYTHHCSPHRDQQARDRRATLRVISGGV